MESDKSRKQGKSAHNPEMGQDLFKNLPSEILLNILSRIPAQSTFSCKCACKPWLDMLMTDEFVKTHLSRSVPGLAVCQNIDSSAVYVYDELGLEHVPAFPCKTVFNFNTLVYDIFHSSVNGLLFMDRHLYQPDIHLSVCNPITHHSITIRLPAGFSNRRKIIPHTYGFEVSKITGKYKLVRIFNVLEPLTHRPLNQSKGHVYTIGTKKWRSIPDSGPFRYGFKSRGVFVNGNLHWLVLDSESSPRISCFDVEAELFSSFVTPSLHSHSKFGFTVSGLKDSLCLCDNSAEDEIVIWLMKEYEDEHSWTKEFIISRTTAPADLYGAIWAIKVFENGDVLIARECSPKLLCYSNKTRTIR